MKIDPINPLKPAPRVLRYMDNKKKEHNSENEPKDSYVVSEKKPASEKTTYTRDQVSIKRLMKESERTYQQLIDIVENLYQGESVLNKTKKMIVTALLLAIALVFQIGFRAFAQLAVCRNLTCPFALLFC